MHSKIVRIILLGAVLVLPTVAHADMGGGWVETPLNYLEILHLFILNAVIGIGEALVVWALLRVRPGIGAIIGANYLSALIGFLLAGSMLDIVGRLFAGESLLQLEVPRLVIIVLVAFVLTVLIEWPFFVLSLRGRGFTARRMFFTCAVAQVASYICLTIAYYHVSDVGALSLLEPVAIQQIATSPPANIYYIDQRGRDLWRIATNGTHRIRLVKARFSDYDQLSVKRCDNARCSIQFRQNHLTVAGICADDTDDNNVVNLSGTNMLNTKYQFVYGGIEKFEFGDTTESDGQPVALETPLDRINIDSATLLPNHRAVFEMSDDSGIHEIDLLDLDDGRVAKLADGYSPVVVLDRPAVAKPLAIGIAEEKR